MFQVTTTFGFHHAILYPSDEGLICWLECRDFRLKTISTICYCCKEDGKLTQRAFQHFAKISFFNVGLTYFFKQKPSPFLICLTSSDWPRFSRFQKTKKKLWRRQGHIISNKILFNLNTDTQISMQVWWFIFFFAVHVWRCRSFLPPSSLCLDSVTSSCSFQAPQILCYWASFSILFSRGVGGGGFFILLRPTNPKSGNAFDSKRKKRGRRPNATSCFLKIWGLIGDECFDLIVLIVKPKLFSYLHTVVTEKECWNFYSY